MSDDRNKMILTPDQVVSRQKGIVKYISNGTLYEAHEADVTVLKEGEKPPVITEVAKSPEAVATAKVKASKKKTPKNTQNGEAPPAASEQAKTQAPAAPAKEASPAATQPKPRAQRATKTEGEKTVAAKKAKKAARNGHSKGTRTINGKSLNLDKYKKVKSAGGGVSYHADDKVGNQLEGKTLDEAYSAAAKALGVSEKELRAKYKNLNPGMQRMNLGNRMRAAGKPKAAKSA